MNLKKITLHERVIHLLKQLNEHNWTAIPSKIKMAPTRESKKVK